MLGMINLVAVRYALVPADHEHRFGHGKAESMAAMVVALVLLGAAVGIAVESVRAILEPRHSPAPFTLIVLVLVGLAAR